MKERGGRWWLRGWCERRPKVAKVAKMEVEERWRAAKGVKERRGRWWLIGPV